MKNRWIKVAAGLSLCCVPSLALTTEAAPGLEGLCDGVEFDHQAGSFEVGALQIWRGPFDLDGARIVGCLRNNTDEEITGLNLVYDNVQASGGGGGSGNLEMSPLAPGATGLLMTSTFRQDPDRLERYGITGVRLRELQVPRGWEERTDRDGNVSMHMAHDSHAFEPRPELDYPLMAMPDSGLAAACAAVEPVTGTVEVSELRVLPFPDGQHRLVGCLLNGTDVPQADGFSHSVSVSYSIQSTGLAGGWGNLRLAGAVAPGEAAVFVSGFDLSGPDAQVTLSFQ